MTGRKEQEDPGGGWAMSFCMSGIGLNVAALWAIRQFVSEWHRVDVLFALIVCFPVIAIAVAWFLVRRPLTTAMDIWPALVILSLVEAFNVWLWFLGRNYGT